MCCFGCCAVCVLYRVKNVLRERASVSVLLVGVVVWADVFFYASVQVYEVRADCDMQEELETRWRQLESRLDTFTTDTEGVSSNSTNHTNNTTSIHLLLLFFFFIYLFITFFPFVFCPDR